jgi:hypothetical protein
MEATCSAKRWLTFDGLHSVTFLKIKLFIITTMKPSNPTRWQEKFSWRCNSPQDIFHEQILCHYCNAFCYSCSCEGFALYISVGCIHLYRAISWDSCILGLFKITVRCFNHGNHIPFYTVIDFLDIHRNRAMHNVQKVNNCINIPLSKTFRSYLYSCLFCYDI